MNPSKLSRRRRLRTKYAALAVLTAVWSGLTGCGIGQVVQGGCTMVAAQQKKRGFDRMLQGELRMVDGETQMKTARSRDEYVAGLKVRAEGEKEKLRGANDVRKSDGTVQMGRGAGMVVEGIGSMGRAASSGGAVGKAGSSSGGAPTGGDALGDTTAGTLGVSPGALDAPKGGVIDSYRNGGTPTLYAPDPSQEAAGTATLSDGFEGFTASMSTEQTPLVAGILGRGAPRPLPQLEE